MTCRFAAGFVDTAEDVDDDAQARARLGAFNQLLDQRYALKDDTFTGPRDMREDPVFTMAISKANSVTFHS